MDEMNRQLSEQWNKLCLSDCPEQYLHERGVSSRGLPILTKSYDDLDPYLQTLFRLGLNGSLVELYTRSFDYWTRPILPQVADMLVGLILRSPGVLQKVPVMVNGETIWEIPLLRQDEPTLIAGDYVIPTLYSGLHLSIGLPVDAVVDLVMGNIGDGLKPWLREQPVSFPVDSSRKNWITLGNGALSLFERGPDPRGVTLAPVDTSKYLAEKKRQATAQIMEELMSRAWHPARLDWCLDLEEQGLVR